MESTRRSCVHLWAHQCVPPHFLEYRHSILTWFLKVQLPSYNFTKQQIVSRGILPADSTWTFLLSSSVSGACVVRTSTAVLYYTNAHLPIVHGDATCRYSAFFITVPHLCADFRCSVQALTRMYNQPTTVLPNGKHIGALYKNPIDCLYKTFQAEGVRGWYKGEPERLSIPCLLSHIWMVFHRHDCALFQNSTTHVRLSPSCSSMDAEPDLTPL